MKRLLFVITMVMTLLVGTGVYASAVSELSAVAAAKASNSTILCIGNNKAYANGNAALIDSTNPDVVPFIKDDRTLVPVRFIAESLGATVGWDGDTSTAFICLDGNVVEMTIGSNVIAVNGIGKEIDVPAQTYNDRTFIPLRVLVEALGKNVFWDDRGLIIISERNNVFDAVKDKSVIDEVVNKFKTEDKEVNVVGNTGGNIANWGEVAKQGDWIYYADHTNGSLYKVNRKTSENIKISDDNVAFINVIGDWIYYTNWSDRGKLYKIKTDGTLRTKLSNHNAEWVNVIGDWIYFSYSDYNGGIDFDKALCKIKTNGTNETKLVSGSIYFVNVNDNWIYYEDINKGLCKIKTDGTNQMVIDGGESGIYGVSDGWIYYSVGHRGAGDNKGIYKIKIDGTNKTEIVADSLYNANLSGGWIYYSNGDDKYNLYKIRIDGTGKVKITNKDSYGYSNIMGIVGDWIYYQTDFGEEEQTKYYRIKIDGTQQEKMFITPEYNTIPVGEGIELDKELIQKLDIFFSNFSEVDLPSFEKGKLSDDEMILFGIHHIAINDSNYIESGLLDAKYVTWAENKYFGKTVPNKTVLICSFDEDNNYYCTYKDGYYTIPFIPVQIDPITIPYGESGRAYSKITKVINNGNNQYTVYLNNFISGDYSTAGCEWDSLLGKMKATIEKQSDGRYILIDYLKDK